ncbi:hypothetical protein DLAC_06891 [Tieghemostelium lacteum]|uniref:Transglutaminase-like domain-containing protein n=1 Tax=Tieghemostelium lacteum TaxID=361077 RepID=A0A151ZDT8_TIELA|nr:hypothetical protein DLAC_06891 [Tieghemostelium lacteum]|eukprot:KYQ92054.1 hypothetical protein DLAC_06891 [Tieghemostelium lacteum]
MTNPPFELKDGLEVRLRSKKGLKNRDGSPDWYLSVVSGKLVADGGPSAPSVWILGLNADDKTYTLKSKSSNAFLGISETLTAICNADAKTNGKFELFWQENGKVCLMSHQFKGKPNLTGKPGPHLGINPKSELIANAGRGEWGQWSMLEASDIDTSHGGGGASALSSVNSPAMKLLTNFQLHREMWDQRFMIERKPSKSVKAKLLVTYKMPNMRVQKWCVVANAPPVIQCQNIRTASLKLLQSGTDQVLAGGSIIQAGNHSLFRAVAKGNGPSQHQIQACYEIEADLFSLSLKKIQPGEFIPPVNQLQPHERAYHLQATSLIDFNSTSFRQWVDSNQLHPMLMSDGSVESLLCFCYRVFLFIKIHFSYVYAKDVKGRKATDSIQARATDCGGFCILASAIFRLHGIPSRLLFGRHGVSGTETEQKVHVKGEFYCDTIGWIPFDPATAITGDHQEPYTKYFGNDGGGLIVMHLDHGIQNIDTLLGIGNQSTEFLQGCAYWVSGDGEQNGKSVTQLWTCQDL